MVRRAVFKMLVAALPFGSAVIFATSALAATVTSERGEVLVNRGQGYKLVTQPTQVAPGDQVVVNPRSSGQVVYADGCVVKVEPGVVVPIAPQSPCERRGSHVETGGSLKDGPMPVEARDDRKYVVGAVVLGGAAIGAILLLSDKDKPAPASP